MEYPTFEDLTRNETLCSLINSFLSPKSQVRVVWKWKYYGPGVGRFLLELADQENIGGRGVTSRSLSEVESELPGITKRLETKVGKVVFIGNGLSDAPLFLSSRYERGETMYPPFIADALDYRQLMAELLSIEGGLKARGIRSPFYEETSNLRRLLSAVDSGTLVPVNYRFGLGHIPCEIRKASLVVNCHGPPISTLAEQLALIAPAGELYVHLKSYMKEEWLPPGQGFKIKQNYGTSPGFIVRREN